MLLTLGKLPISFLNPFSPRSLPLSSSLLVLSPTACFWKLTVWGRSIQVGPHLPLWPGWDTQICFFTSELCPWTGQGAQGGTKWLCHPDITPRQDRRERGGELWFFLFSRLSSSFHVQERQRVQPFSHHTAQLCSQPHQHRSVELYLTSFLPELHHHAQNLRSGQESGDGWVGTGRWSWQSLLEASSAPDSPLELSSGCLLLHQNMRRVIKGFWILQASKDAKTEEGYIHFRPSPLVTRTRSPWEGMFASAEQE